VDALKACSEWLQAAAEQLGVACQLDTDADTDALMDKLASLTVSLVASLSCCRTTRKMLNLLCSLYSHSLD